MSIRHRYPKAKQSRLENWVSETKYCFLPRNLSNVFRKSVARASRRICALVSGFAASKLETVFFGRRKLSGMIDLSPVGSPSSLSISREERPR